MEAQARLKMNQNNLYIKNNSEFFIMKRIVENYLEKSKRLLVFSQNTDPRAGKGDKKSVYSFRNTTGSKQ
jgi:hypothetical protein